jgi:molybdate/tungstate transport system permease protein
MAEYRRDYVSMSSLLVRGEAFLVTLSALATLLICFIVVPITALFLMTDPATMAKVFGGNPMLASQARSAFIVTFKASLTSTVILLVLGVPLAYILARYEFPGKSVIESLVDVPLMIPHIVAGIMILMAFGRRGLIASLTGLAPEVEDTFWGVVLAMAFVSVPLAVDTVKVTFQSIDPTLESVARTLGASHFKAFATVTLPLALKGVLAGAILAWARGLSEVGSILVVAYYPKTVNVLILEWLNIYGLKYAIALAVPFVLIALALFTALRILQGVMSKR